jgi:hypothetical protein
VNVSSSCTLTDRPATETLTAFDTCTEEEKTALLLLTLNFFETKWAKQSAMSDHPSSSRASELTILWKIERESLVHAVEDGKALGYLDNEKYWRESSGGTLTRLSNRDEATWRSKETEITGQKHRSSHNPMSTGTALDDSVAGDIEKASGHKAYGNN